MTYKYGEQAFKRASTPADKVWVHRGLGWALCRAGEINRGIDLLAPLVPVVRAWGHIPTLISTMCFLGAGYWLAENDEKARETLEEVMEMSERCGARYYFGWTHRLLGERAMKNNPTQAAFHFDKSISVLEEIKAENELAQAYVGYGRLQKKQGKITQARKYLMKALEIFERLGTQIEPDKVRKILAELPES